MRISEVSRANRLWAVVLLLVPAAAYTQTVDVAWTFGNVGSSSYRLDAFEPVDAGLGTIGGQDPTLPLELGQRYEVTVTNYTVHPFEVLAKAPSASQDQVLLSMGSFAGPFESDPEVQWEDDGQGTVRFTLTDDLYQAMLEDGLRPGYRCRPHLFAMRGDFTVVGLPRR